MVLEKNELLLDLKKLDTEIPFEIFKQLTPDDLNDIPVVLRRGAVDITLGTISKVRIGASTIYGEARIGVEGHLEFEPILKDEKIIGVKIKKFVYQVA